MGQVENGSAESGRVLCVDLDGTLLASDSLHESVCLLMKTNPLLCLPLPFVLLRDSGKAVLKQRISQAVEINPSLLPYNPEVLAFLQEERAKGREIVLVTASDERVAQAVAGHLGLFSRVIASDGRTNLRGKKKLEVLSREYGEGKFDYIGNDWTDLPVWRAAAEAYVVSSNRRLITAAQREAKVARVFEKKKFSLKILLRMLRVHQWVKNLLLFVPLIMAHRIFDWPASAAAAAGFLIFCLCSSGVYIINDLTDIVSDRMHAQKRLRPFASGDAPLALGALLGPLMLIAACLLAAALPFRFLLAVLLYIGVTFAYSCCLKQIMLIDILVLAGLYTLRVLAGAFAAGVPVSPWLLAFSMFMFLSLACVKRFSELYRLRSDRGTASAGRGYVVGDLEAIGQFGSASGFLSVLVLALYTNGMEVQRLYHQPAILWLLCPLLLYWVSRIWLLAYRGQVHEDPILFAIRDRVSYVVGAVSALLLLLAKGLWV